MSEQKLCTDCGTEPVWSWSDHGYCRRCNEKNGYVYESGRPIDPDRLTYVVGRDHAARILAACAPNHRDGDGHFDGEDELRTLFRELAKLLGMPAESKEQ